MNYSSRPTVASMQFMVVRLKLPNAMTGWRANLGINNHRLSISDRRAIHYLEMYRMPPACCFLFACVFQQMTLMLFAYSVSGFTIFKFNFVSSEDPKQSSTSTIGVITIPSTTEYPSTTLPDTTTNIPSEDVSEDEKYDCYPDNAAVTQQMCLDRGYGCFFVLYTYICIIWKSAVKPVYNMLLGF